jgi:hypothetical protein
MIDQRQELLDLLYAVTLKMNYFFVLRVTMTLRLARAFSHATNTAANGLVAPSP